MGAKVFGFCGIECYDLIYYAAKTATHLGFSTLLVDLSPTHEMCYLYHDSFGIGDIVEVNGVSLMGGRLEKGCLSGYEYIFIYYGTKPILMDLCDEFYFVTDFQKQNIAALASIKVPDVPRYLIVRDRGNCSLNYAYILEEVPNLDVDETNIYPIEDSDEDVRAKTLLQYSMGVKFSRLSDSIMELIMHILETDFSHKDINAAWKAIVKG